MMNNKPSNAVNISAFFLLVLFTLNVQAQRCPGVNFQRVGCYKEKSKEGCPLSDLLFTDRTSTSSKWSGVKYAFQEFNAYLPDLACRCAKATRVKGYKVFGLTHYGECYSSDDDSPTFAESDMSSHCVTMNFGLCQDSSALCIGENHSIFVFKLTVTVSNKKAQKAVSASLMQKKLLEVARSSKSSISELACSSYRTTILLDDVTYTDELESYQSSTFMDYRREIELGILQAYDGDEEFQEVQVVRFSSGFERKIVSTLLIKFKDKGKHLGALFNKMASQKLGHLKIFPAVGDCGCYGEMSASTLLQPITTYHPHPVTHMNHKLVTPALCPPECNVTCGAACTPSCCTTGVPVPSVSPVINSAPTPTQPSTQCAVPCGAICAPACTPACCYTIYRPQMEHYWKRHRLHAYRHSLKLKSTNKTMQREA
ncbi:uncharacterized protein LOC144644454 [Oculina patagonica]